MMRRLYGPHPGFVIALIAAGSILLCGFAPKNDRVFKHEDYGFTVTFPGRTKVCPAGSWQSVHGYYTYFTKSFACDQDVPKTSAISIYASYNAAFWPVSHLTEDCAGELPGLSLNYDMKKLRYPGRTSVVCLNQRDDGQVEIIVRTAAGKQREDERDLSSPEVPYVFYDTTLISSADRLKDDLPVFQAFLDSIVIEEPPYWP